MQVPLGTSGASSASGFPGAFLAKQARCLDCCFGHRVRAGGDRSWRGDAFWLLSLSLLDFASNNNPFMTDVGVFFFWQCGASYDFFERSGEGGRDVRCSCDPLNRESRVGRRGWRCLISNARLGFCFVGCVASLCTLGSTHAPGETVYGGRWCSVLHVQLHVHRFDCRGPYGLGLAVSEE